MVLAVLFSFIIMLCALSHTESEDDAKIFAIVMALLAIATK